MVRQNIEIMGETQGERLRRIRDELGMKQIFVSNTAGITQAHLSRIENDESGVTEHTLKKIAAALGVSYGIVAVKKSSKKTGIAISIDSVLADEAAMIRFMGGKKPDKHTYDWVRRSLEVIRGEIHKRRAAAAKK
jgi:transcriptional regulator with XRE-family HTH domain